MQFEKSGLNLVLEYERGGGGVRRAMPLTLNYFPFRSIFPTLKTLSALAEKRNSAEVVLKNTQVDKSVGGQDNNRSEVVCSIHSTNDH